MMDRREFMTAIAAGVTTALMPAVPIPTGLDRYYLGAPLTLAPGEGAIFEHVSSGNWRRITPFDILRDQMARSFGDPAYYSTVKRDKSKPLFDEHYYMRHFENAVVIVHTGSRQ